MICRPFTLCLALLGLLSLPVFAAGTADDLLALHQMRLATQKSLNAFFMYVGQEGDQRYASLIESSAQTAEARLQRLDGVNGSESRRLLGQLREQWRDYAQDLDKLTGAVRNKGYSDLQPVADLARRNQQLMDLGGQLYRSLQRENAATVPTLTEQSREQSLLMQDIALDYASRNASVGASFFGGGEGVHWTTWPAAFGQPVEAAAGAAERRGDRQGAAQRGDQVALHREVPAQLQPEQRAVPGQQECRPDHRWPGEGRRAVCRAQPMNLGAPPQARWRKTRRCARRSALSPRSPQYRARNWAVASTL